MKRSRASMRVPVMRTPARCCAMPAGRCPAPGPCPFSARPPGCRRRPPSLPCDGGGPLALPRGAASRPRSAAAWRAPSPASPVACCSRSFPTATRRWRSRRVLGAVGGILRRPRRCGRRCRYLHRRSRRDLTPGRGPGARRRGRGRRRRGTRPVAGAGRVVRARRRSRDRLRWRRGRRDWRGSRRRICLGDPWRRGWLAAPRGRQRAVAIAWIAGATALAALALTLSGRPLVGGTIHRIAEASTGSQAALTPLGRLVGEPDFGPVSSTLLGTGEGAISASDWPLASRGGVEDKICPKSHVSLIPC